MSTAGTVIKTLPFAWKVGGKVATDVELREATLEDLLEAEKEAHPHASPTAYAVALACRQMVRAGEFTGPFAPAQFKGMKPQTWYAIRNACDEADALGEAVQPSPVQTD